jgi:hypothetical protein
MIIPIKRARQVVLSEKLQVTQRFVSYSNLYSSFSAMGRDSILPLLQEGHIVIISFVFFCRAEGKYTKHTISMIDK